LKTLWRLPSTKWLPLLTCWGVPVPTLTEPPAETAVLLPERFRRWFAARGWSPREHQLALLAKARQDRSALLIAPTGAGKTLAGFLPTLVDLSDSSSPARSAPLLSRSGGVRGEQSSLSRSGGVATRSNAGIQDADEAQSSRSVERNERKDFISTGRGVQRSRGLHTLYISPLKALAVDIARNLETPVTEMGLPIRV
jgi:ATP-dependent Lhr-like helicase